jgi:hypothetical protein
LRICASRTNGKAVFARPSVCQPHRTVNADTKHRAERRSTSLDFFVFALGAAYYVIAAARKVSCFQSDNKEEMSITTASSASSTNRIRLACCRTDSWCILFEANVPHKPTVDSRTVSRTKNTTMRALSQAKKAWHFIQCIYDTWTNGSLERATNSRRNSSSLFFARIK